LVNSLQERESLWLDAKVVSSWKGPELERVSKVRLVERFRINFGTRLGLANAFINRPLKRYLEDRENEPVSFP